MTTAKRPQLILLGQIINAHGIRGELRVRSFTADPAAIADYGPLSTIAGDRRFALKIVRVTDKGIIARIKGVDDRTAAEALQGTELYVDRALLPGATTDEYYHADLIGLRAQTPDGETIGRIVSVQNFGAGDLIEMLPDAGGPSEFIPFEKAWVPHVDIGTGIVVVDRPAYGDTEDAADDSQL
jgi:16S rRNA processing protein RimM